MRNLMCRLVGHKPPVYRPAGWWSPGEQYGRLIVDAADGVGRVHARVLGECARCGEEFLLARVHLTGETFRYPYTDFLEVLSRKREDGR